MPGTREVSTIIFIFAEDFFLRTAQERVLPGENAAVSDRGYRKAQPSSAVIHLREATERQVDCGYRDHNLD